MKVTSGIFSSDCDSWRTPRHLFLLLNVRFHFDLDPCSTHENALCKDHYTLVEDGLSKSWAGRRVFMNPPYGRDIAKWCEKAFTESNYGAFVCGLLPGRVDTAWWHDYVEGKAFVYFIRGRLKFSDSKVCAPFPSALVFWCGLDHMMEMFKNG